MVGSEWQLWWKLCCFFGTWIIQFKERKRTRLDFWQLSPALFHFICSSRVSGCHWCMPKAPNLLHQWLWISRQGAALARTGLKAVDYKNSKSCQRKLSLIHISVTLFACVCVFLFLKNITALIPGTTVEVLYQDSRNIIQLIVKAYNVSFFFHYQVHFVISSFHSLS